ncbi:pilus assembly protein [Pseudomonas sp. Leaf127]|uniref:Flp family type IVb pilin n=1 Tax=Pseudomonas sp. Leaf127 TaxID=1736267 RepID=UPI0007030D44|nr:Flp family type IVb pilin [Pseudomonas sp. Leaf127]KQQ54943.1 pilus assembly protein [Pseudomonas sp. Leaf127]
MSLTRLFIDTQVRVQQFFKDKEAASAIEYVLIAAMVSVVIVLFVTPLGNAVKSTLNEVLVALKGTAI